MDKKTFTSLYNGEIELVTTQGKKTLLVNGYEESGAEVEKIWQAALDKFISPSQKIQRILILGFAAGSVVDLLNKRWPGCKITGVEIDPVMTMIAKEFFAENIQGVDIVIQDATHYVANLPPTLNYDLAIVDCYLEGSSQPDNTKTLDFLIKIKHIAHRVLINQLLVPTSERMKKAEFLRDLHAKYPIELLRLPFNAMISY